MRKKTVKRFAVLAMVCGFAFATLGNQVFSEDFSEITAGNSTSSSGSSTVWGGNANFPTAQNVYKAGGAVKLGKSGDAGSLTSKELDLSGGKVTVAFSMKGWSSSENTVTVSLGSGQSEEVSCETTDLATGSFEAKSVEFSAGTGSDTLTFTGGGRIFLDDIVVTVSDTGGETQLPSLTINPASVSFETILGEMPDAQTVCITAANQTAESLQISVSGDFEFSIDNGVNYGNWAESTLANGSVSINILVRPFAGAVTEKGVFNGQLAVTGSDGIPLTLTVVDPRPEQLLAQWEFDGVSGVDVLAASEKDHGVQNANIKLGDGITVGSSANRIGGAKFNEVSCEAAITASTYFDIEITARRYRTLEVSRIATPATRSPTGPTSAQWFAKIDDGEFAAIGQTFTLSGTSLTLEVPSDDFSVVNPGEKVVLRLVAWGAKSASGTFYLGGSTSALFNVYGYTEQNMEAPSEPQLTVTVDSDRCNAGETMSFMVEATIDDGYEVAVTVAVDGGNAQAVERAENIGWRYNWTPLSVGAHTLIFKAAQADDSENSVEQTVQMQVGLATPQNLIAQTGLRKLTVDWSAVTGADHYAVSVYRNFGPFETKVESAFDWISGFGNVNTDQGTIQAGQTAIGLSAEMIAAGWTAGEKLYPARTVYDTEDGVVTNGAVRIGTGTAHGWLETPELDLSGNDGQYTITFRAARWKNDSADGLQVVVVDVIGGTAVTNMVSGLPMGDFSEYEITGTGGGTRTKVMFSGRQDANCRVFLDDIKVVDGIGRVAVATGTETVEPRLVIPFAAELPADASFSVEVIAVADEVRSAPAKTDSVQTSRGTMVFWR